MAELLNEDEVASRLRRLPWEREGGRWALRHDRLRLQPDVIQRFMDLCDFQLKFVIDRPADVNEVLALLATLPPVDPAKVLLMPQGVIPTVARWAR